MTRAELTVRREMLRGRTFAGTSSIGEFAGFVAVVIDEMHRSDPDKAKLYTAHLRIRLQKMQDKNLRSEGSFQKYKAAILREIDGILLQLAE